MGGNVPSGHILYQIVIKYSKWKYTNNSIPRTSQIYPNFDFWCENIPSGNPDSDLPRL
jgi:hypothetical protein